MPVRLPTSAACRQWDNKMTKPKLLIVVDDEGLCSQYRWAFPACELVITHARPQALAAALKERPPVAIVDLGLPPDPDGVSEGFATLETLLRQVPDIKVIVATSHDVVIHSLRAVGSGAYDFCEKPMDIALRAPSSIVRSSCTSSRTRTRCLADARWRLSPIKRTSSACPGRGGMKTCCTIEKLATINVSVVLQGESGLRQGGATAPCTTSAPRGTAVRRHQLRRPAGKPPGTASCSATNAAPSPARWKQTIDEKSRRHNKGTLFLDEIGDLAAPLAGKTSLRLPQQEQVVERVGGAGRPSRSTCASSPPPTWRSRSRSAKAASATTCFTG